MNNQQKLGRISLRDTNDQQVVVSRPKSKHLRILVLLAIVLGLVIGLVYTSLYLVDQITPQRVVIEGCWLTTVPEILDLLEYDNSKSLNDLKKRVGVLNENGARLLRHLEYEKRFPRTAVFRVDEFQPCLLAKLRDQEYWLCFDGRLIKRSKQFDTALTFNKINSLPMVKLPILPDSDLVIPTDDLIVIADYCDNELKGKIKTIEVLENGEFNLYDQSGIKILLGKPIELEKKFGAIPKALRMCQTDHNKLKYLDARDPDQFYQKNIEPINK